MGECIYDDNIMVGFPQRLEHMENGSDRGKVMQHEKLAKSCVNLA